MLQKLRDSWPRWRIIRSTPSSFAGYPAPDPWPSLRRVPVHRDDLCHRSFCISPLLSMIGTSHRRSSTFRQNHHQPIFVRLEHDRIRNMLFSDHRSLCSFYGCPVTASGAKCTNEREGCSFV